MIGNKGRISKRILGVFGAALALWQPVGAVQADDLIDVRNAFDATLGTEVRGPRSYDTELGKRVSLLAEASRGRIGVAALDLTTGQTIDVLGNQRFPMASTSKIAIAATFLEGVDQGRFSLTREYPLLVPVRSEPFSSRIAPVKPGTYYTAEKLIDLMLTRSNN